MLTPDEHLAAAKRNEAVAELLADRDDDGCMEWAVTALFYAAVRYGRAWGSYVGQDFASHAGFQAYFASVVTDADLLKHYWAMRTESERGRYRGGTFTRADFDHLGQRLGQWREGIYRLMGMD